MMSILVALVRTLTGVGTCIYCYYWLLGLKWNWDRFDQIFLATIAIASAPNVLWIARSLYHVLWIEPRERAWAVERAARRARHATAAQYLSHARRNR